MCEFYIINQQSSVNIKYYKHFIIKQEPIKINMQILCNEETTYGYKKFIILLLSENKIYIKIKIF